MIAISGVKSIDFGTYDEVWYITNYNPKMVVGAEHHPELSPFIGDYKNYRNNKISLSQLLQNYGNALWSGKYEIPIKNLLKLSTDGAWIQLVCYCPSYTVCHRGVLYKYLKELTDKVSLID